MNFAYFAGGGPWTRRRSLLPPALKLLLLANIGVFCLQFLSGMFLPQLHLLLFGGEAGGVRGEGLLQLHPNLDPEMSEEYGFFQPWQLVTYMFLHGGFLHILFNMLALWMFGVEIEERWGTRTFTTYYFLCGIGGGLLQMLLPLALNVWDGGNPFSEYRAPVPVVGASGAIYGVLLAFGMMFPDRTIFVPIFLLPIGIPARFLVIIYAAISIFGGVSGGGGVAHFAHLGGMLVGYIYIKWQQKRRRFLRG